MLSKDSPTDLETLGTGRVREAINSSYTNARKWSGGSLCRLWRARVCVRQSQSPLSRLRPRSLFPWASRSRALGLRLRPEPDGAGLAARRRRGCGDVRLGPSESRLGRGPPPRGIGGPWPRPALKARGRRLARPGGRGSPGPDLGVGPSGPSASRSPPAPPRRGRSCRRSERRSLPAEAGPAYAVGRALFPQLGARSGAPSNPRSPRAPAGGVRRGRGSGSAFRRCRESRGREGGADAGGLRGGSGRSRREESRGQAGGGPHCAPRPCHGPSEPGPGTCSGLWTPVCPGQLVWSD